MSQLLLQHIKPHWLVTRQHWLQLILQTQQVQTQPQIAKPTGKTNRLEGVKKGDNIHGFRVKQIENIPEFQLTAVKLEHVGTGGEYLHIDRSDANNAFSVGFRTTPTDSTGLPHILEHTTLTGSEKYPCRDPFFKMLNRSMATFMNAMTGPDHTMYPFSTQNAQDYRNLMSVYLDAVFRPNLNQIDFKQEGWRLEHEVSTDRTSPIIFKGVVYNEMKGVFSDNSNIFLEALLNKILPSNTYGVCSGGDPLFIPQLTHEDLKNFHKRYYSPANTKYYSYGNFPFREHLEFVSQEYLKSYEGGKGLREATAVPPETRWSKPMRQHVSCRVDTMAADQGKQSSVAVSHLCCSITDIEEVFLLQVLGELLVKGPNAAFYKTLIEPNIGAGFSPVTGYESHTRDTYFTVGLQGVSEKDFDEVVRIFDKTIEGVVEEGFKAVHIEAVLHGIELNTKHQSADFGLGILFSLTPLWNHDGDVVELMKIEKHVKRLREKLKEDPKYLQKKVKEYFVENTHRLVLTMSPDTGYEKKLLEEEKKLLDSKLSALDEEQKKEIYEEGLRFLEERKDDRHCLPTLRIKDLNKAVERVRSEQESVLGVPFLFVPQPTNGVTYFRGIMSVSGIEEGLKPYLGLFAKVATKMGTKKRDYRAFDQLASLKTGGISIETHLTDRADRAHSFEDALTVSSYCLDQNVPDMFGLISELFKGCNFEDEGRFKTLITAHAANLASGVSDSGHHLAILSASSVVSPACAAKERNGGMTYINLMKVVAQDEGRSALPRMMEIYRYAMNREHFRCALNLLEGKEEVMKTETRRFVETLQGEGSGTCEFRDVSGEVSTQGKFYVLPFPISFASKSAPAVPYSHKDFAPLRVLTRLVTMNYLHPEVREKGGAYGSGLSISTSGVLNFYSYRDPNARRTLDTFDNALNWLQSASFTEQDLEEAKLGIFQGIDAPTPPGAKAMQLFLYGISDDMLERHRLELMGVDRGRLLEVAQRYLDPRRPAGRCVIGPENKAVLDRTDDNWTSIVPKD